MTTAAANPATNPGFLNPVIRVEREYPHPRAKVWRALTDPALMALWSMRPEGFEPVLGNRFRFVGKPQPGWRGFVDCEILEVGKPSILSYSWVGDEGQKQPMRVTFRLTDTARGTRLTLEHTGFSGIGGFVLAKLMMGPGWRKMLRQGIANVLDDLTDDGMLRPGSMLKPKY